MDFFKNRINLVLIGVILLLVSVVGVLLWHGRNVSNALKQKQAEISLVKAGQSEEAAKKTKELLDEIKKKAEAEEKAGEKFSQVVNIPTGDGSSTMEAVIVAPGNSPIAVETGAVMTNGGQQASNIAEPGSQEAPQASYVVDPGKLPENTIKLSVTSYEIKPAEFRVKAGQAVSLSVTVDEPVRSHLLMFDTPLLNAVRLSLNSGQTKVISFNAPLQTGEYLFFSDMHRERGSVTKMIVE
jgi:plastocyanin